MHIGLLFGGQSAEHEISIASAQAIYTAADRERYVISLIEIGQDGGWRLIKPAAGGAWPHGDAGSPVVLLPHKGRLLSATPPFAELARLDVVFPVLHGPNGEDGTVQGLLQAYGIACVGSGVLGSAIGMDKDVMKRLLLQAGLPTARCLVLHSGEANLYTYAQCARVLGSPLFVKPANTGSSVGIGKAATQEAFDSALAHAFRYDHKVVVEEFIEGREIECAVIGSVHPRVSVPGEIVTTHEFYSYKAKYQDEAATTLLIPADLPDAVAAQLPALAIKAYRALCCAGMARVDFFLDTNDHLWINEVNTIPGFTRHSMFPVLWAHTGLSFAELIDELIADALARHVRSAKLLRNR